MLESLILGVQFLAEAGSLFEALLASLVLVWFGGFGFFSASFEAKFDGGTVQAGKVAICVCVSLFSVPGSMFCSMFCMETAWF